jgi:DNA-binding MarR family transcriptional regulator
LADDVLAELARTGRDDLGRLLTAASRAINAELMTRLAASGHPLIRPAHLPVFTGLAAGGRQISELAAHAGLTRQALSSVVREVEALGYVRTLPDPADRRAVLIELTDLGIAMCRTAITISREITAEFVQRWGADAVQQLRDRLEQIPAPGTDG